MRQVNGTHTALSFILPKANPAFRQSYPALFTELADSGFHVAEVIVEDGHQTMEQALFVLANEMHESDVIVLVDQQSATYDFVELSARSLSMSIWLTPTRPITTTSSSTITAIRRSISPIAF